LHQSGRPHTIDRRIIPGRHDVLFIIAGLGPAIHGTASHIPPFSMDHRIMALRVGPVMTFRFNALA